MYLCTSIYLLLCIVFFKSYFDHRFSMCIFTICSFFFSFLHNWISAVELINYYVDRHWLGFGKEKWCTSWFGPVLIQLMNLRLRISLIYTYTNSVVNSEIVSGFLDIIIFSLLNKISHLVLTNTNCRSWPRKYNKHVNALLRTTPK